MPQQPPQSYVQSAPLTEEQARGLYRLLHRHARNGYERGDCHCEACGIILADLEEYFGLHPGAGVYDPAAQVRAAAAERGWS